MGAHPCVPGATTFQHPQEQKTGVPLCQSNSGKWAELLQKRQLNLLEFHMHCFITVIHETSWTREKTWIYLCVMNVSVSGGISSLQFQKTQSVLLCLFILWLEMCMGVVESRLHIQALLPTNYRNVTTKLFLFLPKSVVSILRQRLMQTVSKEKKKNVRLLAW